MSEFKNIFQHAAVFHARACAFQLSVSSLPSLRGLFSLCASFVTHIGLNILCKLLAESIFNYAVYNLNTTFKPRAPSRKSRGDITSMNRKNTLNLDEPMVGSLTGMSAPTSSRVLAGCCASDEPVTPTGPHHPPRSNVGSRPARRAGPAGPAGATSD